MEQIAICMGDTLIYWSGIIIALGVMVCFAATFTLYSPLRKQKRAMWLYLPLAAVLSVLLSRFIHWYCHAEQYAGLMGALTDYTAGGYCLPGVMFGVILAVLALKLVGFERDPGLLLDCTGPGAALMVALIRLSALFNSACRGKITFADPTFQRLPFASPVETVSGELEYHLATFFIEFILMLIIFVLSLKFFLRNRTAPMVDKKSSSGNSARYFAVLFCAAELLTDSTRNDSSYMHFNGFVSLVQMVSAITIAAILVYYSVRSVRYYGVRGRHWAIWIGYFLSLAGVGIMEYLVQRHGDWSLICYSVMTVSCIVMSAMVHAMYRTLVDEEAEEQ